MADIAKTARFWDNVEKVKTRQFWDLPAVRRYRRALVTGGPDTEFLDWFKVRFAGKPARRGISLGCGEGHMERRALSLGLAEAMVGIDVSPVRLQQARLAGRGQPLSYQSQDLNRLQLSENSFDFALCKTILHHIEKLEHVFSELRRGLAPGALLYVEEYVGPSRFQFPERMLQIAEDVLDEIPPVLRRLRQAPGHIKSVINRIDPAVVDAFDPSEAVRSADIERLLKREFQLLAERDAGGSLLFRLLDGICHNFDDTDEEHNRLLQALCTFEQRLTSAHILPELFKVYVLQNP